MEHEHMNNPWLFYTLGYIGILIHIVKNSLKLGNTFLVLITYLKQNSLSVFATFLTYNALCAMWMWSNIFEPAGMVQGELNVLLILVGFNAQLMFNNASDKLTGRFGKTDKQIDESSPKDS